VVAENEKGLVGTSASEGHVRLAATEIDAGDVVGARVEKYDLTRWARSDRAADLSSGRTRVQRRTVGRAIGGNTSRDAGRTPAETPARRNYRLVRRSGGRQNQR